MAIRKYSRARRAQSRKYGSKGAARKRALAVRGGFAPMSPRRGPISVGKPANRSTGSGTITTWKGSSSALSKQIGRIGWRLTEKAFERYGPQLAAYAEKTVREGIKRRGKKAKSIEGNETQPFRKNTPMPFFEESESARMQKSNMAAFASKKFTTRIRTGYPTTKSVNTAALTYGVFKKEKFNTLSEFISAQPSTAGILAASGQRLATEATFGFNQKAFIFLNALWNSNINDIQTEFNIATGLRPYQFPKNQYERLYGLVQRADTQIKVSNSNQYYPVKIKVHMVAHDDKEIQPGSNLADTIFNEALDTQLIGRVPLRYQFSTPELTDNYVKVLTSRRCNPNMSTLFKRSARIVNTTSKRLNPGDVWNFNVLEQFGAGIDIQRASTLNTAHPLYYSYLLELVGVECEAVQQSVAVDPETFVQNTTQLLGTYIGTSPGEINFEGRRSITFVSNPNPSFPPSGQPNDGMLPTAAVKLYVEEPTINKEFNRNHDKIGLPGELGKELFIPVVTDKDLRFSQSATATDAGTSGLATTNQILAQLRDILDPPSPESGFINTFEMGGASDDEDDAEPEL